MPARSPTRPPPPEPGSAAAQSPPSDPSTVTIPVATVVSVSLDKLAVVDPISDQLGAKVGDTIHYTYLVTNTGNVSLTAVTVADPTIGPVTCPTPSPPLAPLNSVICTADNAHTVTTADVDAGFVTDTATATGTGVIGGTSDPSDPATATIPTAQVAPLVAIAKNGAVSPASRQTGARPGDTISFSYLVTNIGNIELTSVAVDDPTLGSVTCPAPAAPGLSPGDSLTCTADQTHTVSQADAEAGQVVDTATATGVGVSGGTSPRSDPSTVTIPTVTPLPETGGGSGPDGGVPVGGVQTGGRPAPAGHAVRSEALVALGGLAGVLALVLALLVTGSPIAAAGAGRSRRRGRSGTGSRAGCGHGGCGGGCWADPRWAWPSPRPSQQRFQAAAPLLPRPRPRPPQVKRRGSLRSCRPATVSTWCARVCESACRRSASTRTSSASA